MVRHAAGRDVKHIPDKGGTPSLKVVVASETNFIFVTLPAALPNVAHKLVVLAMTIGKPSPAMPGTPAVAETQPTAKRLNL